MVLQRGQEIPVWGSADPRESIKTELQLIKKVVKQIFKKQKTKDLTAD